jgi:hypothetical protein
MADNAQVMAVLQDTVQQIAGKIRSLKKGEPIDGMVDRARGY